MAALMPMMQILFCLIASLRSIFRDRRELALENLAMRQQVAILKRAHSHQHLRKTDRLFWVWLSRLWKGWQESLIIVKPDTVI
jgi:putative transposase